MLISSCDLILIFISLNISVVLSRICTPIDDFKDAQLIMTRSAEIDRNLNRKISIYWYNKNFIKGDIVAIYNRNPKKDNATLLFTHKPNIYSGSVKTPLKISFLSNYIPVSLDFCLGK